MRILYLHQHFSIPSGATASRSWAMARHLAAVGHDVAVVCGQYEGSVTGLEGPFRKGRRIGAVGPINVVEFPIPCGNWQGIGARTGAFLRYAWRAARLALSEKPDLVIASSTPLTVVLPALLARRLAGVPFVYEMRDPWPELPRAMGGVPRPMLAAMEPMANAACRRAAAVIALSEGMAETAIARGASPDRVHVVPNGCDLDLFGPHVAPWRPAEAVPWEALAVYAGAHGRANGLGQLLDAARLLRQRGEERLRLILVGDGAEKRALMERAEAEELHNVTFLDPLPKPGLASLLAGSQIGVHCLAPIQAFAEWTAPNKLMDYMAAGLPVVTNLGGRAARLLADGPAGIATPANDAAALADALQQLARNPSMRAAMGQAGRDQAIRRWDRRLLAAEFCRIAETAAARAARPALAPA